MKPKRCRRFAFATALAVLCASPAVVLAQDAAPPTEPIAPSTTAAEVAPSEPITGDPAAASTSEPTAEPAAAPDAPVAPPEAPAAPTPSPVTFSGYVQSQLHLAEETGTGLGTANADLFEIRRGRFKVDVKYELAELVLQIDVSLRSVAIRDAWAAIDIPWSDTVRTRLQLGLFMVPFGFDSSFGSKQRYFPERSLYSRHFFPGERDTGLMISGELFDHTFKYAAAVVNGQMIGDAYDGSGLGLGGLNPKGWIDSNGFKDLMARVGVTLGPLVLGASGYYGRGYLDAIGDNASTLMVDETAPYAQFTRWAVGADARLQVEFPIGKLDVYGDVAYAYNLDRIRASAYPQPQYTGGTFDGRYGDAHQLAWYLAATQDLGTYFGVGARVEQFDPNVASVGDTQTAVTLTGLIFPSDHTRVVLAWLTSRQLPDEGWLRFQITY